jgi:hypothetical protein
MEYSNVHSTFALYIGTEDQSKYFVFDEGITEYMSRDFARLLNVKTTFFNEFINGVIKGDGDISYYNFANTHPNTSVKFREGENGINYSKPYAFLFQNVWNREELLEKSPLSGLFNEQYLGFTHSQFAPLKIYPMSYTDQTFWIDLYDMHNKNKVELQSDDLLYLETIIISNTPQLVLLILFK